MTKLNILIVYEDSNILAVNKPAGLVVHSDGRTNEPTLVDWVLERYPDSAGIGEPLQLTDGRVVDRPGIVHRIDRETSGVLLVAKTQKAFLHLKAQFQAREIEKTYNTFLYGVPKEPEGIISAAIGRSKRDFRRFAVGEAAKGELREAVTGYRVLETNEQYCFVEARPKTGRTHQLRVHFASVGHPIVCDRRYAAKSFLHGDNLGFERLALHARSISFLTLESGRVIVEAGLPGDFNAACARLRAGI